MLPVPAGSIVLRDARTRTERTVWLQPFHIASTPVTWELYSRVLGAAVPDGEDRDAPAHSISWTGAVSWCNALSVEMGLAPAYELSNVWIAPGVVEGLNPWKDEDHARTQEVPR